MSVERVSCIAPLSNLDQQERSNDYLKNHPQQIPLSSFASSIVSLSNPSVEPLKEQKESGSKISSTKKSTVLDNVWDWVTDKWDSFLEIIGVKKNPVGSTERDRSKRLKILQGNSALDLQEDFKYLDISTMDPLKVMLAVLVRQGELRQEQAALIQQKILLMQEDLKDLHLERMHVQAELALISKRAGFIEKISIGVTAAQVLAGMLATASVVAGAATIATGGGATPFLVATGVLNFAVAGGRALNTWWAGDTREKLEKLQGEMLMKNAVRDEFQFQLKVDVKDMKNILTALEGHAEIGSSILAAQYGK